MTPREVVRELVRGVRQVIARTDLLLVAAAMTLYATLGLVPLLAIGLRLATLTNGRAEVIATGRALARFVPGPLGVDGVIEALCSSATMASWWATLLALLPVSFYAEGTVRALETLSAQPERRSRTLRGRLLTVPLLMVVGVAVTTTVTVLRPLLTRSFGVGLGPRLLGIFITFCVMWVGLTAVLCLVYRFFATTPVRPLPLLAGAASAGSWLAGQTLGYVLALRLITGFARAYGGLQIAGAIGAIAFLLYLNHIVVLIGYALALRLHEDPIDLHRRR